MDLKKIKFLLKKIVIDENKTEIKPRIRQKLS